MFNPDTSPASTYMPSFETAARSIKVGPITAPVHSDEEIETAITALGRKLGGGLVVIPDAFTARSLKSITVSVAYVAWRLGHNPAQRIVVASYSNELAAELHRQFRMVIDAPWYQALFPIMRRARDSGTELVTTAGGSRYATSWAAP